MQPDFPQNFKIPVTNFKNKNPYYLVSINSIDASNTIIEAIANICNESLIYDWLFKENLKGQPYLPKKAIEFLNWGSNGWLKNEYFVFLLLDSEGSPVGAMDIKSADLAAGEVGYWCSSKHSGLTSNALKCLCQLAGTAGFKTVFAQTKAGNERSEKVLTRCGFQLNQDYLDLSSGCTSAFALDLN
ncbi:MAG: GNAT family N-acetyltransferase [Halobacteriovoraceae bacterium]|jgi:RimJ/RimL family protein N-acetyltransferase|nr:GNAT family N-acetyltransferase [Halobacteriovoraceae bacterium]